MYTIIGGDGKEYGPVAPEQVRAWIASGRANMETRVKAAASGEWGTVADFPELTGQGPAAGPLLVGRAPNLDILSCYERSWELLKANFWPLVGVSFLMAALVLAVPAVQTWAPSLIILGPLFEGSLIGGWYYYFLKRIRGERATLGDAFGGFTRAFGALVATGFLVTTFTFAGLTFWEAMEGSRRTITRQWWRVFGLILLGIPFLLLGIAAFGIGVLVALPLVVGAQAYAYEDLCNPKG
jgi:hypothetical protein